jgi:hypothetical protein
MIVAFFHDSLNFIDSGYVTVLDNDGDLVAFSTGEELLEALGFVDNGLFRVFIRPSKHSFILLVFMFRENNVFNIFWRWILL